MKVLAVNDKVQRDCDATGFEPIEDAEFLRMGFGVGDFGSDAFFGSLKTELKMVETFRDQRIQFAFIERQAGTDQVDVKPCGPSGLDNLDYIGTNQRFAAREINLHNAEGGSLAEDARPVFSGEFILARHEFERIRAVDAVKRATVREFSDESERVGRLVWSGSVHRRRNLVPRL